MEGKTRRDFIKTTATGIAGAAVFSSIPGKVLGANDKVRVGVIGSNSRGFALTKDFAANPKCEIVACCDVDSRVVEKTQKLVKDLTGNSPKGYTDMRKLLESKDVDAVVIATPDHWHAPATILALKAGKHVYVEKPLGHNPGEGELVVKAQKKYNKVVQMGNQQRSSKHTIELYNMVQDGIIGRPYMAKAFYANKRGPIGTGKPADVPKWLDWELWQGPAPRVDYRDNLVHYNWHWFWRWGTGESCNNATHELDVCRWFLNVDFPVRSQSFGGRYHYSDDWEFFDTQYMGFDFEDNKSIMWEGRSCNGFKIQNRGRGSIIYGTEGTVIVDRSTYEVYDKNNKLKKDFKLKEENKSMDTRGGGDEMTYSHIDNFLSAVISGEKQNSPVVEAHKSVLLCHLGNLAQKFGRSLEIDPMNGRILHDSEAMKMWNRDYEPGWEPTV